MAFAGLAALFVRAHATRRWFRAGAVFVLALAMFVPCLYFTFLWNRLRYLWPFATGWFIGLACLARLVGNAVPPAVAETLALSVKEELAKSSRGIRLKRVA